MSTNAPGAPTGGHRPGSPGYRAVMVAVFTAGVATFALMYATQSILPELGADFGLTPAQATLSVSLTTAALALTLLVVGPLSEAVGRTPLIHASAWAAAVVGLGAALAPSWPTFLALRVVEGVALAGVAGVATAYLAEELDAGAQARAAGLYIAGTALGGMVGRLATAPVADLFGWRWAMASIGVVGLGCAVVVARLLPSSRAFHARVVRGATVVAMARAALGDRALLALYAIGACGIGTTIGVYNALGFRLTGPPFHLSLAAVGLYYLAYPLGSVSSTVAGRWADRVGRRAVMPVGSALALAGVVVTLVDSVWVVAVGMGMLMAGFFAVHGLASGWVTARARAAGVPTAQRVPSTSSRTTWAPRCSATSRRCSGPAGDGRASSRCRSPCSPPSPCSS